MEALRDQPEKCKVNVSDIMEYPTEMGSRCLLLQHFGLDVYWNTEEEILDALTNSAGDPECLDICLKTSRCQAFWKQYQKGLTPFAESDPIRLLEYDGK